MEPLIYIHIILMCKTNYVDIYDQNGTFLWLVNIIESKQLRRCPGNDTITEHSLRMTPRGGVNKVRHTLQSNKKQSKQLPQRGDHNVRKDSPNTMTGLPRSGEQSLENENFSR